MPQIKENSLLKVSQLIQLSSLIRKYIKEWIKENPSGEYKDAVSCVSDRIMIECNSWNMNRCDVEKLIKWDKKAWKKE